MYMFWMTINLNCISTTFAKQKINLSSHKNVKNHLISKTIESIAIFSKKNLIL
jgi:hypothetical protein